MGGEGESLRQVEGVEPRRRRQVYSARTGSIFCSRARLCDADGGSSVLSFFSFLILRSCIRTKELTRSERRGKSRETKMGELKQYTYEDLRKSSNKSSTIVVIHNNVYDLTEFLNEHPGGEEVLLDHAGKDATEDFNDVGHSTDAIALMSKYQVGEIVEAERRNVQKKEGWPLNSGSIHENADESGSGLPIAVMVVGVFLGLLAVFYMAM